jgi:hypothetical protein
MRSAPASSTSIDNKIGYNFSVHRPRFLPSPMSSLQAAATGSGDTIHLSPLRYSRPFTTNAHNQPTHPSASINPPPPGLYQQLSEVTMVPSSPNVTTGISNSTPSAFSSLRQASTEAGLHTCDGKMMGPSNQWPINQVQSVNSEMHKPQSSFLDIGTSLQNNYVISHETEYSDEEPEMTWNPPIREAIFSESSPLPIYSPLTVSSSRSTPTPSFIRDHVSADQVYGYHATGPASGSRHKSGSPNAFVPIQEWDNEVDEALSYKENASDFSASPTKLSSASKSWEPQADLTRFGTGIMDSNDPREKFIQYHHRNEANKQPFYPSNLKTPTKASSLDYLNNGFYGNCNKMAPSPTFTVETADMTLDTPSIAESYSVNNYGIKASSLLLAMGAPPIYSSPPQPPCNMNNKFATDQKKSRQSSLSIELASGRHREYPELAKKASRSPDQGSLHGCSMDYSQYNFCYSVTDQDQAQFIRPQSAPTFGRPTVVAATKIDEDAQQRKCRVKTELCMHYENGRPCPFGTSMYILTNFNCSICAVF